jgi:hypothetical protein
MRVDNESSGCISCLHDNTDIRRISDTESTDEVARDVVASMQLKNTFAVGLL